MDSVKAALYVDVESVINATIQEKIKEISTNIIDKLTDKMHIEKDNEFYKEEEMPYITSNNFANTHNTKFYSGETNTDIILLSDKSQKIIAYTWGLTKSISRPGVKLRTGNLILINDKCDIFHYYVGVMQHQSALVEYYNLINKTMHNVTPNKFIIDLLQSLPNDQYDGMLNLYNKVIELYKKYMPCKAEILSAELLQKEKEFGIIQTELHLRQDIIRQTELALQIKSRMLDMREKVIIEKEKEGTSIPHSEAKFLLAEMDNIISGEHDEPTKKRKLNHLQGRITELSKDVYK